MSNRLRWRWIRGLVATASLVAALLVWRSSRFKHDPPAAPQLEEVVLSAVAATQRALAPIRVSAVRSRAQAENLLESARLLGDTDVPLELQRSLREALATWLTLRATDDVEGYIEQMESAGNVVSVKTMQSDLLRDRLARFTASSPVGEVKTPQDVVRVMWWLEHEFHGGCLHIRKIAGSPDGVILSFSRVGPGESPHFPGPEVGVGSHWYGFSTICGLSLWDRPTDWQSVVSAHGEILECLALLVCEGATGRKFPVAVRLFYNPDREAWWVDSVAINSVEFAGPGLSF